MVSTIGSPNYNLAKELARILAPLVGNTPTHIKNSTHFVQLTKDMALHDNDLLVSFDVKSLFTKVPIDEAMQIAAEKLQEDETLEDRTTFSIPSICQLVEGCLRSTYFHYDGRFWEQRDGAAIGSPLSPVMANL